MVAFSKNFDGNLFQLRNALASQADHPLNKEVNELSNRIRLLLISGKEIERQLPIEMLSSIFDLRMKALKWFAEEQSDYFEMFKDIFSKKEEVGSNPKLRVLIDNVLFALRCNQRVMEAIQIANNLSPKEIISTFAEYEEVTYQQFVAALSFANPVLDATWKILNFMNASLHIEFVLLATDLVGEEETFITDQTIHDLAFLVADAAQEYSALATELGIVKVRSERQLFSYQEIDSDFILEQRLLADQGLDDYGKTLENE